MYLIVEMFDISQSQTTMTNVMVVIAIFIIK